jgi:acyl carrier protein
MDNTSFLTQFKDQFVDADEITVTMETSFRELGSFDSLTGMAIIVMIKDDYGVDVSEKEFKSCQTVGDVYELVRAKSGEA